MCSSQEEGELNSGCWHALKGALLMEKVHMMGNSGTQSPSEGAREGSVTEPSESGCLRQGPPDGSSSHGVGGVGSR